MHPLIYVALSEEWMMFGVPREADTDVKIPFRRLGEVDFMEECDWW
jgi:hypothetical protein